MLNFSLILFFIGVFFIGLSGASYRWRAFTNKKAWDGITIPSGIIGIVIFLISLVFIYFNYPK